MSSQAGAPSTRGSFLIGSVLIYARGLCMGAADLVPGVSGGTIALVTGIYERLIFGLRNLNVWFVVHFFKGNREQAKKQLARIDLALFLPLLLGIGTALLAFSRLVKSLLEEHPAATFAFFFGLILASSIVVLRRAGKPAATTLLAGAVGLILAFLFVGLEALKATHSGPIIFGSGFVAICAMMLPGISGAFLLLFLNQYGYMLEALTELRMATLGLFALGALLGLLSLSRLLGYLLERHRTAVLLFLTGLMLGSLRLPVLEMQQAAGKDPSWLMALLALAGFALVLALELKLAPKGNKEG